MGARRSPLGQFFIDNASMPTPELRELVAKTFPDANLDAKNFQNYRSRAKRILEEQGRKKPGPKPGTKGKPKDFGSRPPAEVPVPDLLSTDDARQLTALIMRVGLNTAEQVMARLKHIEAKQR